MRKRISLLARRKPRLVATCKCPAIHCTDRTGRPSVIYCPAMAARRTLWGRSAMKEKGSERIVKSAGDFLPRSPVRVQVRHFAQSQSSNSEHELTKKSSAVRRSRALKPKQLLGLTLLSCSFA